jgi:hypothetical protein
MKYSLFSVIGFTLVFAGCSSNDDACEDITLASEQVQQCQILHRQIVSAKGQPLVRTELERRYQQDCIDIRYYRDEKQLAICGNKHRSEEIKESMNKEANSN